MATSAHSVRHPKKSRHHPFGEHGVLLALPISAILWAVLVLPFI
ncbi:MAG: hypothetical protein OSB00_13285 [Sphingomonas bacterium]|nr:hypothetical protein [Sphingomonas bacterium]